MSCFILLQPLRDLKKILPVFRLQKRLRQADQLLSVDKPPLIGYFLNAGNIDDVLARVK